MLYRKFEKDIETFMQDNPNKILLVNGARQIGKSFIIRHVGRKLFKNFIEINLKDDKEGEGIFNSVNSKGDFYLQLGAIAGNHLGDKENTLVFLDEIQSYPHLLTMLKFLNEDGKYRYIASGSQLGIALYQTPSIPIGSISVREMYPLDFEEFLLATGCGTEAICGIKKKFEAKEGLNDSLHKYFLNQFLLYLIVGGLPEAVNKFIENRNVTLVRKIQQDIQSLYRIDASQYDAARRLVIRKIYDLIPSYMENKKKRVVFKNIEDTAGHKQFSDYADEFEYLTNSGIALQVQAISNPKFPLLESGCKNLCKLYLNDVGLLTNTLYGLSINAILNNEKSINLGSVYESVVAQELCAHGYKLYYYDNKKNGEVDFLVDDYKNLSVLPIEVKSGKNYTTHSSLSCFLKNKEYGIDRAVVLSNEQKVFERNGILYMPVYYIMFFTNTPEHDIIIPDFEI